MPESVHHEAESRDARPGSDSRERMRLSMLRDTCLFNHPEEQEYEEFVVAASALADTPVALISLIDSNRQWFKATVGVEVNEIAHCVEFCTKTIEHENGWLVVEDTLRDPRFVAHPLVLGGPRIRFLAGMPIRVTDRQLTIGTMCVVDSQPRHLPADRLTGLRALGRILENFVTTKISVSAGKSPRPVI